MKTNKIFFLLVVFPFLANAQTDETPIFKNKIAGGGYYDGAGLILEISYSKLLKHRNELIYSVNYLNYSYSNRNYSFSDGNEFIGSTGFNYSFIKKDKKFNFSTGVLLGFNFYYETNYYTFGTRTYYRFGPLLFLNLSPSYQISKRISIIFEIKMGPAYQFNNSKNYYSGWCDDCPEENDWWLKGIIDFKAGYSF